MYYCPHNPYLLITSRTSASNTYMRSGWLNRRYEATVGTRAGTVNVGERILFTLSLFLNFQPLHCQQAIIPTESTHARKKDVVLYYQTERQQLVDRTRLIGSHGWSTFEFLLKQTHLASHFVSISTMAALRRLNKYHVM